MESPALMHKLMEIERALGPLEPCAIRNLILEAQNGVRRIESENEHLVLENSELRRRVDQPRRSPFNRFALQSCSQQCSGDGSCAQPSSDEAPAPATFAEDSPCDPKLLTWRTTHFFFS